MGAVLFKAGVTLRPHPAGARILGSLDRIARELPYDLTVTCGADAHPVGNPHTRGCAFDVRVHGLSADQRLYVLRAVLLDLQEDATDAPLETSGGLATRRFFGWLEHPGTANEHLHFQLRKGRVFPS